jgi:hypothetical protein
MRQLCINIWDFLFEPAIMDKTLRQIAAGSLEIETGTQAVDFGAIVLDNTVPNNFHATSVAEVQNTNKKSPNSIPLTISLRLLIFGKKIY